MTKNQFVHELSLRVFASIAEKEGINQFIGKSASSQPSSVLAAIGLVVSEVGNLAPFDKDVTESNPLA